eukprot:296426-Chlamydomonas_euryale.AAC.1
MPHAAHCKVCKRIVACFVHAAWASCTATQGVWTHRLMPCACSVSHMHRTAGHANASSHARACTCMGCSRLCVRDHDAITCMPVVDQHRHQRAILRSRRWWKGTGLGGSTSIHTSKLPRAAADDRGRGGALMDVVSSKLLRGAAADGREA